MKKARAPVAGRARRKKVPLADTAEKKNVGGFACMICGREFTSSHATEAHITLCHKKPPQSDAGKECNAAEKSGESPAGAGDAAEKTFAPSGTDTTTFPPGPLPPPPPFVARGGDYTLTFSDGKQPPRVKVNENGALAVLRQELLRAKQTNRILSRAVCDLCSGE